MTKRRESKQPSSQRVRLRVSHLAARYEAAILQQHSVRTVPGRAVGCCAHLPSGTLPATGTAVQQPGGEKGKTAEYGETEQRREVWGEA